MTQLLEDPLHYSLLEESISIRLSKINSDQTRDHYQYRIMKSGMFKHSPVKIISQLNLTKKSPYYQSLDSISHQLSLLQTKSSLNNMTKINSIVLIPEFITNRKYLLTHVYDPKKNMLAMYLYPNRFNLQNDVCQNINNQSVHNSRFSQLQIQESPGILAGVINLVLNTMNQTQLHSYFVRVHHLNETEKRELEICNDLYNHNHR